MEWVAKRKVDENKGELKGRTGLKEMTGQSLKHRPNWPVYLISQAQSEEPVRTSVKGWVREGRKGDYGSHLKTVNLPLR